MIERLEGHRFKLIANEFFSGLPAQLLDKYSAWGIEAAICNDSSSMILKLCQLIKMIHNLPLLTDTALIIQSELQNSKTNSQTYLQVQL